jgi:hypothetical protein
MHNMATGTLMVLTSFLRKELKNIFKGPGIVYSVQIIRTTLHVYLHVLCI